MADEILINKRIKELDPNALIVPLMQLPAYNPQNDKTERIDIENFVSVTTQNFEWVTDNGTGYLLDDVVTWNGKWWQSLVTNNLNNVPGVDPTKWVEVSKSPSGFVLWQPGIFPQDIVVVLHDNGSGLQLWYLTNPTRPFVSSDFAAEATAGDWIAISATVEADEGIQVEASKIKLGSLVFGTNKITSIRYISVENGQLIIAGSSGGSIINVIDEAGVKEGVDFQTQNLATLEYVSLLLDFVSNGGVYFNDQRTGANKKGIEYASFSDYATELGPDSLVPRSLVESLISASASNLAIDGTYVDIAAMLADQVNQEFGAWYLAQDASADPTVVAGWAIYHKLAPSTGALSDYFKIAEEESLDLVVNNASETDKGIVEEATQVEVDAGTDVGGTGAKLFIVPSKLAAWWTAIKAAVITFAAQITFTSAPKFNSTTANEFLKVDSNKDLISVAAATQAEMVTGTDNTKPATAKSVEDKRSIKSRTVSNSATGTTNIDCQNQQECKILFNTTITGAVTITRTNDSNLEHLFISIPVTGAGITIEFPSNTRRSRIYSGGDWNATTKVLTITAIGTDDQFHLSLAKGLGGTFNLTVEGPTPA